MQQTLTERPDAAAAPTTDPIAGPAPGFDDFGVSAQVVQALRMRGIEAPFARS